MVNTHSSFTANYVSFSIASSDGTIVPSQSTVKLGELTGNDVLHVSATPYNFSLINTNLDVELPLDILVKDNLSIIEVLSLEDIKITDPTGETGITGSTGITGVTGTNVTANHMSELNIQGSTIEAVLGGGFTVNGANTIFTIPTTGRYFISYTISVTAGLLISSRIFVNGATLPGSTIAPVVSLSQYDLSLIAQLTAGSSISLQLFGLLGAATLQGGTGASLVIIRIS